MATYTAELRTIQNNYNIFDHMNYNLYNNDYKKNFEEKFINHFYYREIGFETVGRFIKELETTLNTIYPYYEHLYRTMCYDYNPLENYNLTENITENNTVNENNTRNNVNKSSTTSDDVFKSENNSVGNSNIYDTPITPLVKKHPSSINDTTEDNITNSTNKNISLLDSDTLINEDNTKVYDNLHNRHTFGNIGVQTTQDMIKKEREIIVNIDLLIFDELDNLFMQVW